jgi:DNA-directed RNA polymerase subunit N (RpoN/RPB10)
MTATHRRYPVECDLCGREIPTAVWEKHIRQEHSTEIRVFDYYLPLSHGISPKKQVLVCRTCGKPVPAKLWISHVKEVHNKFYKKLQAHKKMAPAYDGPSSWGNYATMATVRSSEWDKKR